MSIRVSPNHGVNPSVGLCFFCNKAKDVILLGAMSRQRRDQLFGLELSAGAFDVGDDAAAPRQAVYDQTPCAECRGLMEMGIICISVDPKLTTDMKNPWRSGGWCVVKEDLMSRFVQPPELLEQILHARVAFLEDEVWDAIGLPRGEKKEEEHVT